MELTVNGKTRTLKSDASTLAEYLQAHERVMPDEKGVAVALNGTVVSKARWTEIALQSGDTLEVVRAFQGG